MKASTSSGPCGSTTIATGLGSVVRRFYDDAALQAPPFAAEVARFAEDCRPLLEYGWDAEAAAASE